MSFDESDLEPLTTNEIEERLRDSPWLRPYLQVGDTSLDQAQNRFDREQLTAARALRRARITVATRLTHSGVITTSFDDKKRR